MPFFLAKKKISGIGLDLSWHSTYSLDNYYPPLLAVFRLRLKKPPNAVVALPILSWTVKAVDQAGGELWLLDITSIESGQNFDLHSYPYLVRPSQSFVIFSKTFPPMMFEAMNEQEQERTILGLRYIIWNFMVHAVIGQEFFGVVSHEEDLWESDALMHTILDNIKIPR